MTRRAVILGFFTALAICLFTYFNDSIIRQTRFIGSLMPVAVFGGLLCALPLLNPLLGRRRLRTSELLVAAAIALAACGWPGSNFLRTFTATVAMPGYQLRDKPSWQAAGIMSYLPGGSPHLAGGHVRDFSALARSLTRGADGDAPAPLAFLWQSLPPAAQAAFVAAAQKSQLDVASQWVLLAALNQIIDRENLLERAASQDWRRPALAIAVSDRATDYARRCGNRQALVQWLAPTLLPMPPGAGGWLLSNGELDPQGAGLLLSGGVGDGFQPLQIPWRLWWPTLRLWVPLTLALGLAAVCLALIVHPQWSNHELLPYPVARLALELTATDPDAPGRLPSVMRSRLFWLALAIVFCVHVTNGLAVWRPGFISIPLRFDFLAFRQFAPTAATAENAWGVFLPRLYFTLVGLAFFLRTEVSLSLGLAGFAYLALSSLLNSRGLMLAQAPVEGHGFSLLLFGAWAGGLVLTLYLGRRFYASVALGACGFSRRSEVPAYSVWAARGLAVAALCAVAVLTYAGLDWTLAILVVLLILLLFVVLARINAETGSIFVLAGWVPSAVLVSVLGDESLGPGGYFMLSLVSVAVVGEPREAIMPLVTNGLRMAENASTSPRRLGPVLAATVAITLLIGLVWTLWFQYRGGLDLLDRWATDEVPRKAPDTTAIVTANLAATGNLSSIVELSPLQRVLHPRPRGSTFAWIGAGFSLVIACAAARLWLPWWPLHPVIFMVFGTNPIMHFHYSFLLGWLVKTAVVKLAGTRGYRAAIPFMVGLVAADLLAALLWTLVGAGYWSATGLTPAPVDVWGG